MILHLVLSHLLQFINILGLLEVELKNVKETSVEIQHCRGDCSWSKHLADNTISVLKLDGNQKLSGQR